MPPAIREELAMLRESFLHSAPVQDHVGQWWARLPLDDRRLLLALCGLDDSVEGAMRHWSQLLLDHRDKLLAECRRFIKIAEPVRWA